MRRAKGGGGGRFGGLGFRQRGGERLKILGPGLVRRLARFGSGWIPWGDAQGEIIAGIATMRELVAEAGGTLDGKPIRSIAQVIVPATSLDGRPVKAAWATRRMPRPIASQMWKARRIVPESKDQTERRPGRTGARTFRLLRASVTVTPSSRKTS